MKQTKKLFNYQNKIILTNGSSLKITSIKYVKNYQFNINLFQKTKLKDNINQLSNENKSSFLKKIKTN